MGRKRKLRGKEWKGEKRGREEGRKGGTKGRRTAGDVKVRGLAPRCEILAAPLFASFASSAEYDERHRTSKSKDEQKQLNETVYKIWTATDSSGCGLSKAEADPGAPNRPRSSRPICHCDLVPLPAKYQHHTKLYLMLSPDIYTSCCKELLQVCPVIGTLRMTLCTLVLQNK